MTTGSEKVPNGARSRETDLVLQAGLGDIEEEIPEALLDRFRDLPCSARTCAMISSIANDFSGFSSAWLRHFFAIRTNVRKSLSWFFRSRTNLIWQRRAGLNRRAVMDVELPAIAWPLLILDNRDDVDADA